MIYPIIFHKKIPQPWSFHIHHGIFKVSHIKSVTVSILPISSFVHLLIHIYLGYDIIYWWVMSQVVWDDEIIIMCSNYHNYGKYPQNYLKKSQHLWLPCFPPFHNTVSSNALPYYNFIVLNMHNYFWTDVELIDNGSGDISKYSIPYADSGGTFRPPYMLTIMSLDYFWWFWPIWGVKINFFILNLFWLFNLA